MDDSRSFRICSWEWGMPSIWYQTTSSSSQDLLVVLTIAPNSTPYAGKQSSQTPPPLFYPLTKKNPIFKHHVIYTTPRLTIPFYYSSKDARSISSFLSYSYGFRDKSTTKTKRPSIEQFYVLPFPLLPSPCRSSVCLSERNSKKHQAPGSSLNT